MDIETLKRKLVSRHNAIPGMLAAALFAYGGYVWTGSGGAATFAANAEAEAGVRNGAAAIANDVSASGGQAVAFGSEATPTGPGYFVDCINGVDSRAGTTAATAWKTLARAGTATLSPGETLWLARGCNFTGPLTLRGNGTAAQRVVLDAYGSGAAPVISLASGAAAQTAVVMDGTYQTVRHIRSTGSKDAGITVAKANGTVEETEIDNSGFGIWVDGAASKIYKVAAHDLKMVHNTPGGDDDYGAAGFVISAHDAEVSYSSCIRCTAPSYDYGDDGGFVEIWQHGGSLNVHHNWAEDTNGFFEVGGDDQSSQANGVRVRNNVLIGTGGALVLHGGDAKFSIPLSDMRFEHNTLYEPEAGGSLFYFPAHAAAVTVRNNIFHTATNAGDVPGTHTNNLYYRPGSTGIGFTLGSGEVFADPRFVNTAAKNFHLQSTSPARGIGATGLGITIDYDGQPLNSPPDAGAFQFK